MKHPTLKDLYEIGYPPQSKSLKPDMGGWHSMRAPDGSAQYVVYDKQDDAVKLVGVKGSMPLSLLFKEGWSFITTIPLYPK